MFSTIRKARREHRCDAKSGCVIRPGEGYTDDVMPPWTEVWDDPDGPPVPLGEWWHRRYHAGCGYETGWV